MNRRLFIDRDILETRVAVIEGDSIVEILVEPAQSPLRHGEVRQARVTHINHDIQAATVDAGNGLNLFLRANDARVLNSGDGAKRPPIGQIVKRGQNLLVQLGREALDGKQARCSADIALGGRFVTLHPLRQGLEPGRRPLEPDLKAGLDALAAAAHVTVRAAAHQVAADTVLAEAEKLMDQWGEIAASQKAAPGLRHPAPGLLGHALQHLSGSEPDAIMVSDRGFLAELKTMARQIAPDLVDVFELTDVRRSLDLDEEIEAALATEISVGDKLRLSIEATRAMTVVDVDGSGKPIDVNLQIVPELARQLRLRHIGGPVAIDFVSMAKTPERKKVESALRQAMKADPEPVEIGAIDRFGILTLARRRNGPSLAEQLSRSQGPELAFQDSALLARLLRRAALDLSGMGLVPVVLTLSDKLKKATPADLDARLVAHLGRPIRVTFDDRPDDDFSLTRDR